MNKEIIGFFSGLPMKLSIYGKEITVYNISFLCIHIEYRKHKLAEIMFKEMFRRTYLEDVYQNIFVSRKLIPKTNNIPNFQNSMDNIPSNKFNNNMKFFGYRSYQ